LAGILRVATEAITTIIPVIIAVAVLAVAAAAIAVVLVVARADFSRRGIML
jgi:hypothetical protein